MSKKEEMNTQNNVNVKDEQEVQRELSPEEIINLMQREAFIVKLKTDSLSLKSEYIKQLYAVIKLGILSEEEVKKVKDKIKETALNIVKIQA